MKQNTMESTWCLFAVNGWLETGEETEAAHEHRLNEAHITIMEAVRQYRSK